MNESLIPEEGLTEHPPDLWRTKLRSTKDGIDHSGQEKHCFSDGVVGVGWGIAAPVGADVTVGTTGALVAALRAHGIVVA